MDDRRTQGRKRALAAGHLVLAGGGERIGCVLRDLSGGGARLIVDGPGAPLGARLLEAAECGGARPVRIAWRGAGELGVEFLDDPGPARDALAPAPVGCAAPDRAAEDAARLAERIAAVTRPRARPLPAWIDAP